MTHVIEEKVVTTEEMFKNNWSAREAVAYYRDWLLGGKTLQWEYQIDPRTQDLILKRY